MNKLLSAIDGANEAKMAEAQAKQSSQPAKLKQAEANYQMQVNASKQLEQNVALHREQMELMKNMQESTNKVMMQFMEMINKKL